MIALDGELLPGSDYKINASFELASEDLSGIGSFTLQGEQGIKPKALSISCLITFKEQNLLTRLTALAQAENENGARKVYVVSNELCDALKIRQVKFDKSFSANEDQSLRAWSVRFKLLEVQSVPEKAQQQRDQQNEQSSSTTAQTPNEQVLAAFDEVNV